MEIKDARNRSQMYKEGGEVRQTVSQANREKRWNMKTDAQKKAANYETVRKHHTLRGEKAITRQKGEDLERANTREDIQRARKNKRGKIKNIRSQMTKDKMARVQRDRKNPPSEPTNMDDFFDSEPSYASGIGSRKEGRKEIRKARKEKRNIVKAERKDRRNIKKASRQEMKEHKKETRKNVKKILKGTEDFEVGPLY